MGAMRSTPDDCDCLDRLDHSRRVACKPRLAGANSKWPDFEVEAELQGRRGARQQPLREESPADERRPDLAAEMHSSRRELLSCPERPRDEPANPDGQHPRLGHFQAPPRACTTTFKQHPSQAPRTATTPKTYPNNTLVEDLSKCHEDLWPKAARATSKTIELIKFCLPAPGGCSLASGQDSTPTTTPSQDASAFLADPERRAAGAAKRAACDAAQLRRPSWGACQAERTKPARRGRPRKSRSHKFPMPESILTLNSTLTQDDYDRALCMLTGDIRFQLHLLLYRRLQTVWLLCTTILCILLPVLLAAGVETLAIAGSCSLWLLLQALGLVVSGRCRKRLDRMLERSVAQVNSYFLDHNLMLGVINVGGLLTRSRLVVPVLYFDTFQCIEQVESIVSADLKAAGGAGANEKRRRTSALDYSKIRLCQMEPNQRAFAQSVSLKLAAVRAGWWRLSTAVNSAGRAPSEPNGAPLGPRPMRAPPLTHKLLPRSLVSPGRTRQLQTDEQQLAKKIVLRYSQRWISHFDRRRLMFTDDQVGPRHLSTGKCLCQFIEEHFKAGGDQEPLADLNDQQPAPAALGRELQLEAALARTVRGGPYDADKTVIQMPAAGDELDQGPRGAFELAAGKARSITPLTSGAGHCDIFASTLSHLVGLRERNLEFVRDASDSLDQSSHSYSSKLIEGFASHLQQERLDASSSPTTEISSELDSELLLSRNDELFRKLKALLELRSSEFSKGLDGGSALTATSHHNHQQSTTANHSNNNGSCSSPSRTIICDNQDGQVGELRGASISSNVQTNQQRDANNNHASPISQLGKKFFTQADGLFFLGAKRSQQGVYAKQQQQMLRSC